MRLRVLIITLLAVAFLGALDHTVVSTSLATIAGELGALSHMSWIVVAYTLASTVLLPVIGKLGDILGPRRVFLASLAVFVLASAVCGFAQDMVQLLAARVVQGMSAAGIQLMSQTIVARVTTPRERPRALGIVGAAFPVAIVVGPAIGGLLVDGLGWPWVFWINVPIGIAAFIAASLVIPPLPAGERHRFDIPGAVVMTLAMVALILALTWLGDDALRGPALGLAAAAAALFAAFIAIERRAASPVLPVHVMRGRTVLSCLALSAVMGLGFFSIVAFMPTYVQMAFRTSATVSGLVPMATVFGMLASNLATGHLASRSGRYRVYAIVGTAIATAGLVVMSLLPPGAPLWAPMAIMAVVGVGQGMFMNLIIAVVQSVVPTTALGSITATMNLLRQIGATIGTAAIGAAVAVQVAAALPGVDVETLTPQAVREAPGELQATVAELFAHVFAPIFAVLAGVYALGIVAAILLPGGRLSDEPGRDRAPEPAATRTA